MNVAVLTWVAIGVGVLCGLLALRELLCWYFRITKIAILLEEIRDRLPEKVEENIKTSLDDYPKMKDGP